MLNKIASIPVLGPILRWASHVAFLTQKMDKHKNDITDLRRMFAKSQNKLKDDLDNIGSNFSDLTVRIKSTDSKITDVVHEQTLASKSKSTQASTSSSLGLLAEDHSLDQFYIAFENEFRGKEEDIIERQKIYLSYFKKLKNITKSKPVLDIGCGRGEFLEVLKTENIPSLGLDLNSTMVKRSEGKGFDVVESDALEYLLTKEKNSFSAITGFHIVEHIPFSELMKLYKECYRTVSTGGFVLFETPNPENLSVGSYSFYLDPSHLKPVPPSLLAFSLEYVGFKKIEIVRLHPEIDTPPDSSIDSKISNKLFGPRDYAVIAYK